MGEIVKGIYIPDEVYLAYPAGEGPQLLNANQEFNFDLQALELTDFLGMRLDDVATIETIQAGESTEFTAIKIADGGLSVEALPTTLGPSIGLALLRCSTDAGIVVEPELVVGYNTPPPVVQPVTIIYPMAEIELKTDDSQEIDVYGRRLNNVVRVILTDSAETQFIGDFSSYSPHIHAVVTFNLALAATGAATVRFYAAVEEFPFAVECSLTEPS